MHFLCYVVHPAPQEGEAREAYVHDALAPFDENLEVEEYVVWERARAAEYQASALAYVESQLGRMAATQLEMIMHLTLRREALRAMSPEQWWEEEWSGNAGDNNFDEDGNVLSRSNPDGHWDWWEIGGRWAGYLLGGGWVEGDSVSVSHALAEHAARPPAVVVTPDGEWLSRSGWDESTHLPTTNPDFDAEACAVYRRYPQYVVTVVDCHT